MIFGAAARGGLSIDSAIFHHPRSASYSQNTRRVAFPGYKTGRASGAALTLEGERCT